MLAFSNQQELISLCVCTAAEENNVANLRALAEKHPSMRQVLLEKADVQEKKHKIIKDENAFAKLLDQLDTVLQEVEKELSSRDGKLSYTGSPRLYIWFECVTGKQN